MRFDKLNFYFDKLVNNLWFLFVFVFVISLLIRLPYIGVESINPDAVNWHSRCQQVANGIKYFQFEKTYPHYHPGYSLCLIMLFPTEIYKQLTSEVYNSNTFITFNIINTVSLVLIISLLIAWASVLVSGRNGLLFSFLLNIEPFFYGNSRLIHLDILTSMLIFIGVFYLIQFLKSSFRLRFLAISSLLMAFAFLTKSVAIVFVVISSALIWYFVPKRKLFYSGYFLVLFSLIVFLIFPAMWVNPVDVVNRIFTEADRVGVRTAHQQFFFENFNSEEEGVGGWFYFWTMLIKFSPVIYLSLILLIVVISSNLYQVIRLKKEFWYQILIYIDKHKFSIIWFTLYFSYFAILVYSSKKLDRYLLVLVPVLIYFASMQLGSLVRNFMILLGVINILSIWYFMPYLFLYYSPVFLSYEHVNKIIGQKSFGQGIIQLRDYLVSRYGEVNLGFYDVKPMQTIYPNSKIKDIRNARESQVDVIILSINEKLPNKFSDEFVLKEKYYIRDIPLYEIYTRN